jgi:2'-hydroxyisoflavone reductase
MPMRTRRDFIAASIAAVGAAALRPAVSLAAPVPRRILVLGGTGFVGPHEVRHAVERGHQVTIFNRGRSAPGMFGKDVEELAGDRAGNLQALKGRKWDAVIDESASGSDAPEWVRQSATLLKDATEHYLFISTRAVYLDWSRVPMTADAPVMTRENSPVAAGVPLSYGHAKAFAEQEAQRALSGRVTIVRPGIVVGPGDDTDRFTYWPVRVARGGETIAPGDGGDHVQLLDVRDLVEFNIKLVEDRRFGVFNAVGPQMGQPFRELLERVQRGVNVSAKFVWVDAAFLGASGVGLPGLSIFQVMQGRTAGYSRFDVAPELKAGLTFRPTEVTAKDTLDWFRTLPADRQANILRAFEREAKLLAEWKSRAGRGA